MKYIKINRMKKASAFYLTVLITFIIICIPFQISAKVQGTCANCHTMHNSQDGNVEDASGPYENLLKNASGLGTDVCVGCHASSDASVWKDATTGAPIVWNTSEPTFNPQKGLAGGNFFWVSQNSSEWDKHGHNVYGIVQADRNLTVQAPGNAGRCGESNSCHFTLAADSNSRGRPGCRGCHFETFHHTDDNTVYRYLHGHDGSNYYVSGIEDPDWEQDPSSGHNVYKGETSAIKRTLDLSHSISNFCGGCHNQFHSYGYITNEDPPQTPWIRHPTDVLLKNSGEYAGYNPPTDYDNKAPVAYTDLGSITRANAVVMCLSCHRPHGSEQPDMLRWNYNADCSAGTPDADCGCFTCHTTKDGA